MQTKIWVANFITQLHKIETQNYSSITGEIADKKQLIIDEKNGKI